jgi:hypothetical protein
MKKLFKLLLDDIRSNPYEDIFKITIDRDYEHNETWDIVKTYDEFVDIIEERGLPDLLSLDHDLSQDHYRPVNQEADIEYFKFSEKTGYHAAEWLINYCIDNELKFPKYKVHSQNPQGKKNIINLIETAKIEFDL